jgi:hypothetical protein
MITDRHSYAEIRPRLRSGDAIVWAGKGPLAWFVRLRTRSRWTHISTVIRLKDTGIERVFIAEATLQGVVLFPLSRRIREHRGLICWLPLHPALDLHRLGVRTWSMQTIGRPYDYSSLFSQLVRRTSANARALFCSEFTFMALRDGGKIPALEGIDRAPWPSELYELALFEEGCQIIYGGASPHPPCTPRVDKGGPA